MATDFEKAVQQLQRVGELMEKEEQRRLAAGLNGLAPTVLQSGGQMLQQRAQVYASTEQLRAQTAFLQTPQGQRQFRANLAANRENQQAQQQLLQAQQVAELGKFGAAVANVRQSMSNLAPAIAAVQGAFGTILGLVSKANPNAAATFQGSLELLQARIGTMLIPIVDQVSASIQKLDSFIQSIPGTGSGGFLSKAVGFTASATNPLNHPEVLIPLIGPMLGMVREGIDRARGKKEEEPRLKSLAGMPQASIGTAEQFQTSLQMAALQHGEKSPEAELLKLQYENMQKQNGILDKIANNTEGIRPAFR